MKKTLHLLICILLTQLCLAQDNSALQAHFNALSQGKSPNIPKKERAKYYQQSDVIPLLETYLQSDNEKVQREAVRFCAEVGANNTNPATRKKAVNLLMTTAQTGSAKILKKITSGLEDFNSMPLRWNK